jgi:hypothetical protein
MRHRTRSCTSFFRLRPSALLKCPQRLFAIANKKECRGIIAGQNLTCLECRYDVIWYDQRVKDQLRAHPTTIPPSLPLWRNKVGSFFGRLRYINAVLDRILHKQAFRNSALLHRCENHSGRIKIRGRCARPESCQWRENPGEGLSIYARKFHLP